MPARTCTPAVARRRPGHRVVAALAAVALVVTLGTTVGSPAVEAAGPGQYSDPEWYPLRGTSTVGCTFGGGCGGHHGYYALDLMQAKGSPVYAAGAGQLRVGQSTGACHSGGYGRWVEVDHGGGVTTRYAHLDSITVPDGTWVDQNTRIGTVGSTGSVSSCTSYHLHFEKMVDGQRVAPNPMKGCDGTTYPTTWGYSGWGPVPAHTHTITSTGTCGDAPFVPVPVPPGWESLKGTLVQIDQGPDGQIWGVNSAGNLYEYAGSGSWNLRGLGFRHVTVGRPTDAGGPAVYALTTSGQIRRTRDSGSTWEALKGTLVQIEHGPDGQIWGVNSAGNLYEYAGSGSWTMHDTGYRHVTVGRPTDAGGPAVYALTTSGQIRRTRDSGSSWEALKGTLVQIEHGPDGQIWGVNSAGNLYEYAGSGSWTAIAPRYRHVTAGLAPDPGGPNVYALTEHGSIHRRRP